MRNRMIKGIALVVAWSLLVVYPVTAGQKGIPLVQKMPNLPSPLEIRDWAQVARDYDEFVFHSSPITWDRSQSNVAVDTFFLPSYVGDTRQKPGAQEAINTMAAVVGASLVGIDKSNQNGQNWVLTQKQFFNQATGQQQILNNTQTLTGGSFWYEIFPAMLFFMLVDQYPQVAQVKTPLSDGTGAMAMYDMMYSTAEQYLQVVERLIAAEGDLRRDFPWNSYRLDTSSLVTNQEWSEPDALAGIAWICYMAYLEFGEERFMQATLWALGYLERQLGNPYYEVLLPYGASLAARVNAEHGTLFDVGKILEWVFGVSQARVGWGTISDTWGDFEVHGLQGSVTDGGGYAFAMNTFQAAAALVPLVRYDPRFAVDIGKWLLNLANNARLFYPKYLPPNQQSSFAWAEESRNLVSYEGLRKEWQGQTPYATGDAILYNMGTTDYALYGASHVGFLGGMVTLTDQIGILQVDLLATDHFGTPAYPSYLFYNPYGEVRSVSVSVGDSVVDIYDLVSKEYVDREVGGKASLQLPPESAMVAVMIPSGGQVENEGNMMIVDGVVVDYARNQFVICNPRGGIRLSGDVNIQLDLELANDFDFQGVQVSLGGEPVFSGEMWSQSDVSLHTSFFDDGDYELIVELRGSNGIVLQDRLNVTINNEILGRVYGEDLANWDPVLSAPATPMIRGSMISFSNLSSDLPWAGVQSPEVSIDFSRKPILSIEGIRSRGEWFVDLLVVGEDQAVERISIQPRTTSSGRMELDLRELIPSLRASTVSCHIMLGVQGPNSQISLFRASIDIHYAEGN